MFTAGEIKNIKPISVKRKTNPFHILPGSFVISLLIIFNFIIPTAIIPRSLFITILSFIPFLFLLKKNQLGKKSIILLTIILLITIFTGTFKNLLNLYYIFLFQLMILEYKDGIKFNKNNRILLFIGCFSLIAQLIYYSRTYILEDGRIGLGTDPNFSGLIILLYFFYVRKLNSIIALIPVIIAIVFFQSRTLFISILLFYALEYFSKTVINRFLYKILNPFIIILFSNIFFLLLSSILISFVTFQKKETSSIAGRVLNITDNSNAGRLAANIFWGTKVLTGEYLIKSENLEEQKYDSRSIIMPHNSLLNLLISSTTIFGILYLLYTSYILKPLLNRSNIQYFYSFLFYSIFLHGLFDSIFLFPFLMIFLLKSTKQI